MRLSILLKSYGIAGHNTHAIILESKKEKLQVVNGDFNYYGLEYVVFNRISKNIVYKSPSYKDCLPIIKAIKDFYN